MVQPVFFPFLEFAGVEGWFMGLILSSLPFIILTVLVKLFLSERLPSGGHMPRTFNPKPRIFNNKDAKTIQRIDGNFPAAKRHKIETRIAQIDTDYSLNPLSRRSETTTDQPARHCRG